MKAFYRILMMLLVVSMLLGALAGCDFFTQDPEDSSNGENNDNGSNNNTELPPIVDYASEVKFNPNSGRNYIETTVKSYIDGDTTHFKVPTSISVTGVLKARYLAVNTPESTGQIEPWGKKASAFTREKLESATSIIVESDNANWNPDSTGERFLVWVWYKSADMTDYKCLNLEILQAGLARASTYSDTSYAEPCSKILSQSVAHKLYVFSPDKDPDFYYGSAKTITLKELKTNIDKYANERVAFEGVVVKEYDNSTIYVEEYDEQTDTYFGMQVFYGYNLNFFGKTILTVGNRVRIAGSVQYWENGGTWQLSDIKYDPYDPDSKDNIALIDNEKHAPAYQEMDINTLLNGKVDIEITELDENENETVTTKTFDYGYLALHSTVSMKNLTITSVYTTTKEGDSKGAMTITCKDANGNIIDIRTIVLTDSDGNLITSASFPKGSVINVNGVVDFYDGEYQIKIFHASDITFVN